MPPCLTFAQVKCRVGQSIVGTPEVGAFHLLLEVTTSVFIYERANILVWFDRLPSMEQVFRRVVAPEMLKEKAMHAVRRRQWITEFG